MARRPRNRKKLVDCLVENGLISVDQRNQVFRHQKQAELLEANALLDLRYVNEEQIVLTLMKYHPKSAYLDIMSYDISSDVLKLFPKQMCLEYQFFPLDFFGNTVIIATGRMMDTNILDEMNQVSRRNVRYFISKIDDIYALIAKHYPEKEEGLTSLGSLLLD